MKMKSNMIRWLCLLAAAVILCASAPALAEPAESLKMVAGGFSDLKPVPQTHYLLARRSGSSSWGLIDTAGKRLCPYKFAYLDYVGYDYLQAASDELKTTSAVINARRYNKLALVAMDGTQLTNYAYGYFSVYNSVWAGAWVLENATKEDYDYRASSRVFFKIVRYDLYYLGDEKPKLVASFTRDQILDAAVHGQYISVMNREKKVTIYGPGGETCESAAKKASYPIYKVKHLAIYNTITGETVAAGYYSVREVQTPGGLMLVGSRTDFSGAEIRCLLDLDGNVLMQTEDAEIVSVSLGQYVLLKKGSLYGLYSLEEGRQLLPCAYDKILVNKKSTDAYVSRGYLGAMKDGECHIISAETGEEVRSFAQKDGWEMSGLLYYRQMKSQLHYYSPLDGHYEGPLATLISSRGSGYLLAIKMDSRHIVVNWQGEQLMKGSKKAYTITDDDCVIGYTDDGYAIYKLTESK